MELTSGKLGLLVLHRRLIAAQENKEEIRQVTEEQREGETPEKEKRTGKQLILASNLHGDGIRGYGLLS